MTKKHEELVDEIASLIKIVAIHRNHEVTQAAEGAAMAIIALILSAFRGGRLDEELGVVGRFVPRPGEAPSAVWLLDMMKACGYCPEFIALGKEGTAREEEG